MSTELFTTNNYYYPSKINIEHALYRLNSTRRNLHINIRKIANIGTNPNKHIEPLKNKIIFIEDKLILLGKYLCGVLLAQYTADHTGNYEFFIDLIYLLLLNTNQSLDMLNSGLENHHFPSIDLNHLMYISNQFQYCSDLAYRAFKHIINNETIAYLLQEHAPDQEFKSGSEQDFKLDRDTLNSELTKIINITQTILTLQIQSSRHQHCRTILEIQENDRYRFYIQQTLVPYRRTIISGLMQKDRSLLSSHYFPHQSTHSFFPPSTQNAQEDELKANNDTTTYNPHK